MQNTSCVIKMLNLRLILVLFFLLYALPLHAQNQQLIDSLLRIVETTQSDKKVVAIYTKIAEEYHILDSSKTSLYANKAIDLAAEIDYMEGTIDPLFSIGYVNVFKGNYDASEHIFRKMVDLSEKNSYNKGKGKALHGLGWLNGYYGKNNIALEYLLKSLKISEELNESDLNARNYNLIGIINMKKTNYSKAIEYYFKSLEINEKLGEESKIAGNYTNIGIIYKNQGNYKKSSEYYMKALEVFERLNLKGKMASTYTNFGILHDLEGNYEKALEYQFKAVKIREEFGIQKGIAYNYDNIAMVYMSLNSYSKALHYFSEALKILEANNSNADRAFPMIQMGRAYRKLNQPIKAKKYLEDGLNLAIETGLLTRVKEGAEQLALVEKDLGNYKKAYEANVLFKTMEDSINNIATLKKMTQLESEYNFQKEKDSLELVKIQEITLLKTEAKGKAELTQLIYASLAILLVIGFVGFLLANKNVQQKRVQSIRDHISQDLHDEIGSNLSSISLFGTVAEKSVEKDPKKAMQLISRINSNATQTIESINDIVWAISSENDTLLHLVNRMRSYASELEDTGNWEVEIDFDYHTVEKPLSMIQRRNLYLIFKEAINNAIKYSNGKKILVMMGMLKNTIQLQIIDDGQGFNPNGDPVKDNLFGGNGIKSMKKRAEELNGSIEILSHKGNGTKVIVDFPV